MGSDGQWRNRIVKRGRARIGDFKRNKFNPKHHPYTQEQAARAVLNRFGKLDEIIVYPSERNGGDWTIFDGHLRETLDSDEVWDIAYTDLTDDEADELVLYFDPLAAMARADAAKTAALMADLDTQERALREMLEEQARGLGFAFGGGDGNGRQEPPPPEVDQAEELQKQWQVKPGDIWQIADHYLICGDCREPETWERLLAAAGVDKVNGVFTSPPYAEQRKQQYGGVPTDQYVDWWEAVQGNVRGHLAGDGSFFVNIKPHCEDGQRVLYVFDLVLAMVRRWRWRFVDELCWVHQGMPGTFGERLKNQFEPIYHFGSLQCKTRFEDISYESSSVPTWSVGTNSEMQGRGDPLRGRGRGKAYPGNVVRIGLSSDSVSHAAAFPAALPDFFIRAYSDPGDVWCDPFCGSGTTIVAAHQNQRRGLGIEVLEKYCAVVLARLQGLGLTPRLVEQV